MAIKCMGSMALLSAELAAKFAPVVIDLLRSNTIPEEVKQQAFASGSIIAAKWPALDSSENILHKVGSAASTGMAPATGQIAAAYGRLGPVKCDQYQFLHFTCLSQISLVSRR